MTDANAQVLWWRDQTPFGQTVTAGGFSQNPLRFPGQIADAESGLAYNYFRDYDPALGRYIQSDPIGLGGGLNTYGYVGGNPIRFVDPQGTILFEICSIIPQLCFGPDKGGGGGSCPAPDCEKVRQECLKKCSRQFADDPSSLPGGRSNTPSGMRVCIRDCMAEQGCFDY